jgi:hypothetical protein
MKRSRAIENLVEMAEAATDGLSLRTTDIRWPLTELWVAGDLLTLASTLEHGAVVLMLDEPAEEMPWLAFNRAGEWVGHQLRLGKRPMLWWYRPNAWPAWNPAHRRMVRFWSDSDGLDQEVVSALRDRRLDRLPIVEPTEAAFAEQLREELQVSRRHLREMLDRYWDRDWRREHKGYDESPEDHLWRAAQAVTEIGDALENLGGIDGRARSERPPSVSGKMGTDARRDRNPGIK